MRKANELYDEKYFSEVISYTVSMFLDDVSLEISYTDMKHSDVLMREFVKLLIENIEKETGVSFYAEKLCISKQYLSLIVKDKTRVPVSTIISSLRVDRASRLLRDPDLSIQQIASRLSFSDQSSFGKFFRKHTGMSPLKYRSSLRKTLLSLRPEPSGGKLPG